MPGSIYHMTAKDVEDLFAIRRHLGEDLKKLGYSDKDVAELVGDTANALVALFKLTHALVREVLDLRSRLPNGGGQ
jgi:predicted transcriptional regulator